MRYYIFAASYTHARSCMRKLNLHPQDCIYVSEPHLIMGVTLSDNVKFIEYETFPNHPMYPELLEQIRIVEAYSQIVMERAMTQPTAPQPIVANPNDNFWYRLVNLNPALLRGIIMALVLVAGSAGILIAPGLPDALIGFIAAALALVQALWTRSAVTPNAKVSVYVPDPINAPHIVESGDAVTTASNASIIDAAKATGA